MADNKKQERPKQEIPPMRGTFEIRGIVSAFDKMEDYNKKSQKGTNYRRISFTVKSSEGNSHRMQIQAFQTERVYFSKREEKPDGTTENIVKDFAWKDRQNIKEIGEGFLPIDRVSFGLEKEKDEEGNERNKREQMLTYDAIEKIHSLLQVGQSVYIRGNISVEEYTRANGEKGNTTRFIPTQISLTTEPIDFNAEDFTELARFELQAACEEIEFTGTDEITISGLFIGNQRLGRQPLIFRNNKDVMPEDFDFGIWENVCRTYKNSPKQYATPTFFGIIANTVEKEDEDDSSANEVDEFGIPKKSVSPMRKNRANAFRREFLCTGIVSGSTDTDTYSIESVEKFIATYTRGKEEFAQVANNVDDFDF